MKDEKDLLTNSAGFYAAAAARDASIRNAIGINHFTPKEIAKAQGVAVVIESFYGTPGRKIALNYRPGKIGSLNPNRFIVVKIFTDSVRNKKLLKSYEASLETDPTFKRVVKRRTTGGEIIYRLHF